MHSKFIQKLEEDLKAALTAIEERGLIVDINKMQQIISDLEEKRNLAEVGKTGGNAKVYNGNIVGSWEVK